MIERVYASILEGEVEDDRQQNARPDIPWLGMLPCPIEFGRSRPGVEICAHSPEGPLGRVGVRPSDVLVSIDGTSVTDAEDLYATLARREVGDEVTVGLSQEGHVREHRIRLMAPPAGPREVFDMRWSAELHASLSRRMAAAASVGAPPARPAAPARVSTIDTATIDRVQVIWRADRLVRPTSLAVDGNRLFVADRDRVHIVSRAGRDPITVGGGATEYEFGRIDALGVVGDGEIAVLDGARRRLTFLSTTGEILGSRSMEARQPFINWWPRGRVVPWNGGLLFHVFSGVELGRTTRHAIAWLGPHADTARPLRTFDGETLADLGGIFGPIELFGPTLHLAVSADGRVASGDGLEYCITVESLSGTERAAAQQLCRDRPRVPVGGGIRNPDFASIPGDPPIRRQDQRLIAAQRVGDLLPSYDRLLWSEAGELWVRTLGEEVANVHPRILAIHPYLGPSHRAWDVFDAEGYHARTLRLPAAFDPHVVTAGRVYGFYRTADESVALAMVQL